MLIMSLAHAQTTGDGSLISTYYSLLKQWADYLVDNALSPNDQATPLADEITYTNQTNLALKGICAIAAMGRISSLLNNVEDETRYAGISKDFISQWQTLSVSSDNTHLLLSYGQQSCGGLIYNLYADKLLQLNLVPEQIYQMQTAYHSKQLDSSTYGLPLDTCNPGLSRVDWNMLTAGVMTDSLVRNNMIIQVHNYAGMMVNSSTNAPLMTVYDPRNGNNSYGMNSPTLGAMFSLLALQVPIMNATSIASTKGVHNAGGLAGIIAGSVVGGLVFITLFLLGIRCRRLKRKRVENIPEVISERDDIRTPFKFLLTTMFGRTREAVPFDDISAPEATPFLYRPGAPSLEGTRLGGNFQSTEDMQATTMTDPTSTTTSYLQDSDVKSSSNNPSSTASGGSTSVAESSTGERTQSTSASAGDANEAAYWRTEAEGLRQELEELERHPGDLPPGYSPNE